MRALAQGRSVLVAAPTGAGKTVVGEYAVWQALATGGKCFYTTPIKALSNQKLADLRARHGDHAVGLLTGDHSINGEAPIVVMTTEVLRNMLYEQSPTLAGLQAVVLDEVHYLADRARGAVWEEVIIQLPLEVQLACLSATVSNGPRRPPARRDAPTTPATSSSPSTARCPWSTTTPWASGSTTCFGRANPAAPSPTSTRSERPSAPRAGCPTPKCSCWSAAARASASTVGAATYRPGPSCARHGARRWSSCWPTASGCRPSCSCSAAAAAIRPSSSWSVTACR
ncbi:MAG: hypothetical protein BRC31_04790 [Actinobacteria bacterium QS_5_72_10]|nr:MAG: hypothetical protein BRC31_04790 [Actinobacteria bacterium QS_5_72_10]